MVLQETIKELRRSLTARLSVDKLLRLTNEIFQQLFNPEIPSNKVVYTKMEKQFNATFQKLDGLKLCFE